MNGAFLNAAPYAIKPGVHLSGAAALTEMAPVLITAVLAFLIAILTAIRKPAPHTRWPWFVALLGLCVSLVWQLVTLPGVQGGDAARMFHGSIMVDGWASLGLLLVTTAALAAVVTRIGLRNETTDRPRVFPLLPAESVPLVLISVVGMQLTVLAQDLMVLVLCLEVAGLPLVWLNAQSARNRGSDGPDGTVMRGYLSDILSSGVLLWACVMLLMAAGTTNLDHLGRDLHRFAGSPFTAMGVILVVAGLGWKCAAPPLDFGAPATAAAAPPPTALLTDVGFRLAALTAALRVMTGALGHDHVSFGPAGWCSLLAVLAGVALVVGSFAVMWQKRVADMALHLGIAATGWMLLGIVAYGLKGAGADEGRTGVAYLMANHGVGLVGVLALCWWIESGKATAPGDPLRLPAPWRGLARRQPLVALATMVLLLHLMGFPPTSGFFARLTLLQTFFGLEALQPLAWLTLVCWAVSVVPLTRVLEAVYSAGPVPQPVVAGAAGSGDASFQAPLPAVADAEPRNETQPDAASTGKPARRSFIIPGLILLITTTTMVAGLLPDPVWRFLHRLLTR